jgi:hypothetical protein
VSDSTFKKFKEAVKKAKLVNDEMSNTLFLWYLLELYEEYSESQGLTEKAISKLKDNALHESKIRFSRSQEQR